MLTNGPDEHLNILVILTGSFSALIASFSGLWIIAQSNTHFSLLFPCTLIFFSLQHFSNKYYRNIVNKEKAKPYK